MFTDEDVRLLLGSSLELRIRIKGEAVAFGDTMDPRPGQRRATLGAGSSYAAPRAHSLHWSESVARPTAVR